MPNYPNNKNGKRQAVVSVENQDADADGFTAKTEVTNTTTYGNTPTFPGLTPSNVGNVVSVSLADIQAYLVPVVGNDTTPPAVSVLEPNGGETVTGNFPATVRWTATDASGIAAIELHLSIDNGVSFRPLVLGLTNSGSYTWFPPNRPSQQAIMRVIAVDNAFNRGRDDSNATFTIAAPPGGIAPTTLRDFDLEGSQPFEGGMLSDPTSCVACHGGYNASVEPYRNWEGSMMAHASIDPLFEACMAVANQDAPDSGDLCLRCHIPAAWLRGRSVPTSGVAVLSSDLHGVSCDLCHRMVDPIYDPGQNPSEDLGILAALLAPPSHFGNGMFVVDPTGMRRGPFSDATSGHAVLVSPFHREAALCGTCHDVSNPAFEKNQSGQYVPNAFDTPPGDTSAHVLMPIERTYSEWLNSAYNTPQGVYAPQFGGNKAYVATCQDCHLRDVTGQGCNLPEAPVRNDLPLHDMTGGSTWLPGVLSILYPGQLNEAALQAGVTRARYMLQNAATVSSIEQGVWLKVTVTNETGHKLPTGYPEGRRVWLNIRWLNAQGGVIAESGAYDAQTAELAHDDECKVYEAKPGLDEITAPLVGEPPGPSFHFVLNNRIFKDNRIPPRGFTNAAYAPFGGSPVGAAYADGQHWDDTLYRLRPGAVSVQVRLYYQSTSKEYIEFLRDRNTTNSAGQVLYDLWNNHGKSPPELMVSASLSVSVPNVRPDFDGDVDVDQADFGHFQGCLTGPALGPVSPACSDADFDGDGDVDLADFGVFQRCLSGADQLVNSACVN